MLSAIERRKRRLALWYVTGLLFLVSVLALILPEMSAGESVPLTQTPEQDFIWRECNPTLEAMREQALLTAEPTSLPGQSMVWRECNPTPEAARDLEELCDVLTPVSGQNMVWRECTPALEAAREETQACDVPTPTPAQSMVWRQCNPTLEAMREQTYRWDIPEPTPTPRNRICDCIIKQVMTPTPVVLKPAELSSN